MGGPHLFLAFVLFQATFICAQTCNQCTTFNSQDCCVSTGLQRCCNLEQRNGSCPLPQSSGSFCQFRCFADGQCPPNYKCCPATKKVCVPRGFCTRPLVVNVNGRITTPKEGLPTGTVVTDNGIITFPDLPEDGATDDSGIDEIPTEDYPTDETDDTGTDEIPTGLIPTDDIPPETEKTELPPGEDNRFSIFPYTTANPLFGTGGPIQGSVMTINDGSVSFSGSIELKNERIRRQTTTDNCPSSLPITIMSSLQSCEMDDECDSSCCCPLPQNSGCCEPM